MARTLKAGETLVIASHNKGKVREIGDLVSPFGIEAISSAVLALPEPEETGSSFAANAHLKAKLAAERSGLVALADDSGLAVYALNGAPGVYSARWAGDAKNFHAAMERVHRETDGSPDRRARFVCALCLAWPDGETVEVEGAIEGELTWPPRGENGFGYDPIFIPEGFERTFGEMEAKEKESVSHRARAFAALIRACFDD